MKILAASSIAVVGLMSCLNAGAAPTTARSLLLPGDVANQPAAVKLSDEMLAFFDRNGCTLPKELRDKLVKNGSRNLIPEDLRLLLDAEMNTMVQKVDGRNVNAVLHSAHFQVPGGEAVRLRTTGADSYETLNAVSLADGNIDNFAYTMDCSGFLNAAMSAGGGIRANQAETAAKGALSSQKSMLVVRAGVYSPIALAISPNIRSGFSGSDRISLLYSLINEVLLRQPAAPDNTTITAWRQVSMLWTSNEGSASFQGRASFSGNSGFGAGVVSANGSLGGGAIVGRNISFSNFNTYIIDAALDTPVSTSLKDLYATVETLVNNVPLSAPTQRLDAKYQVAYALPRQLCNNQPWTMASARSNQRIAGTVTAEWANGACKFVLAPAQAPAADERGILLRLPAGFKQVEFSVPVAI